MSQLCLSQPERGELDHSPGANSTNESVRGAGSAFARPGVTGHTAETFTCPGETHPISRSVHLARLAAYYSKCRTCAHHPDHGRDGPLAVEPTASEGRARSSATRGSDSLLTSDGVRGIYLNELDRPRADRWGAALASLLWDEEPRLGRRATDSSLRMPPEPTSGLEFADGTASLEVHASPALQVGSTASRRGPMVVIGFDERPASPDIVTGAASGLRRMGCQVIDLGQTTAACLRFTVSHLNAAAGLFVTGAGCDPAWTGFEVVGREARPWPVERRHDGGHSLEEWEARARAGVARPTRTAGSQRTFRGLVPYEAGLWKHFHALRPLHVACGSATRLLPSVLDHLFARLPCRITHVPLPVRRRNIREATDADVQRVAAAVVSGGQHLGLIVDDDGQRCGFVTERGRLVRAGELARLVIDFVRREHPHPTIVVSESLAEEASPWLVGHGVQGITTADSAPLMTASLHEHAARLGVMSDGRVWFRDPAPSCDAIVTLALVLQALSLSDAPFSEIIAHFGES